MIHILLISLGAALGASLRYGFSLWAAQQWGSTFPYSTLIINVSGSFCIGFLLLLASAQPSISVEWRLLLITGLLGSFTTFSTFSYETYDLIVHGNWFAALLNLLGNTGLGLIACFLGAALARLIR